MKIEGVVADVTPVGSPDRAERDILELFWTVLANLCRICCPGATLRCRKPLLSPNTFTYGHLLKIEWLVANVTSVGFPDRAEHDMLGMTLSVLFANSDCYCCRGATWWCRILFLSLNYCT